MTEADMLNALQARVQRARIAAGYTTDIGATVLVQRAYPTPESDGDLVASVVLVGTEYEVQGIGAGREVVAVSTVEIGAFTIADDPLSQIGTVALMRDVLRATFQSADDVIRNEAHDMVPLGSEIYLAPPGYDYTVVALKLIVRWCDHSLEESP